MDNSLHNTIKKSISEFNIQEARGWTIDELNNIDFSLDEIILNYFKPQEKDMFKSIILNNSILDIGRKLKIISNIEILDKNTIEKIRKLASIRNAFAHASISEHYTIYLKKDDKKMNTNTNRVSSYSIIKVMNASGKIVEKNAIEYLNEFWDLNKEIKNKLNELRL